MNRFRLIRTGLEPIIKQQLTKEKPMRETSRQSTHYHLHRVVVQLKTLQVEDDGGRQTLEYNALQGVHLAIALATMIGIIAYNTVSISVTYIL